MNIFKIKKKSLIADVFPKLRALKHLVRSISKKSRFKGSFGKKHGKRAQKFLKYAWQYLCHIFIAVKAIDLQKVSVTDMRNLKTVS